MPHRHHKIINPKINLCFLSSNLIFLLLPRLCYSHHHPLNFGVIVVPSAFLTFSLSSIPSSFLLISKLSLFFHCHLHSSSSLIWTFPTTWAGCTRVCIIQWFVLLSHLLGYSVHVSPCQLRGILSFLIPFGRFIFSSVYLHFLLPGTLFSLPLPT